VKSLMKVSLDLYSLSWCEKSSSECSSSESILASEDDLLKMNILKMIFSFLANFHQSKESSSYFIWPKVSEI
jgi:hypothetical protein